MKSMHEHLALLGLVVAVCGCGARTAPASAPTGTLTPQEIMAVVRGNQAAVRGCYERSLQQDSFLRGRVQVAWRVGQGGHVLTARIDESTVGSPAVEQCILDEVTSWAFPRPRGGEVDVVFPFEFGPRQ